MLPKEKWVLISVFDKNGIVDFARGLASMGWKILASGGTGKALEDAGVEVKNVAELVGGGAILGHRVVTLSRELHAGLLADVGNPDHMAEMERFKLPIISMVVCDFYPLQDAIAKPGATVDSVIESTDIGGPTMVRSAAKGGRIVVCDLKDRQLVLGELQDDGDVSVDVRKYLRAKAEFMVAKYCLDSARFHGDGNFDGLFGELCQPAGYGENAWQVPARLFATNTNDPLALPDFKLVAGTPPSYNNWCDVERLLQTLTHICATYQRNGFAIPYAAVGAKHGNACGAAATFSDSTAEVIARMVTGDSRAIFGGLLMFNFPITGEEANILVHAGMPEGQTKKFDGVIASAFDEEAIETLSRKKGKCRLIKNPALATHCTLLDAVPRFRYLRGGFLLQPNYTFVLDFKHPELKVFGERNLAAERDLLLAWAVCATSNSNTITIVNGGMLIGNGVGQQDRVGAAELAIKRAVDAGHKPQLKRAVACSDSFFPFADGPKVLIDAGIQAIFSTSGSIRDEAVQQLCLDRGVTLYQLPDSIARGFFGH